MSDNRLRVLYGHPGGRWLLAEFQHPADQPWGEPDSIGDLAWLGNPENALARLYERIRRQQQRDTERARAARTAHRAALSTWETADPATRGPAPEPPPGWLPAKRGPRPGVQQQLADLLGVGQQAVSRYMNRRTAMALADDGWSALVQALLDTEPDR